MEEETVPADVIKEKYGVDLGGIFGGSNVRFNKDAAEQLIAHDNAVHDPKMKKKADFKFYNNSYLYVSFRKEALEEKTRDSKPRGSWM